MPDKTPDSLPGSLPDAFHDICVSCMDATGVTPHHCLHLEDGKLTLTTLLTDMTPGQIYQYVIAIMVAKKPTELIFGLDRFCKPNQGTTLGDCVAGHYFAGGIWQPFIIEYQHEPRIVHPFNWNNSHWNAALKSEMRQATGRR